MKLLKLSWQSICAMLILIYCIYASFKEYILEEE